jgi:hypothetical protein
MTKRSRNIAIGIAALIGVVIALNLLANGLDRAVGGNEPGGERDSSYATAADGAAAYASLLARYGHSVGRQRGEIEYSQLVGADTVIVLDPAAVTDEEAAALLQFAGSGGRLVIGDSAPYYLDRFRDAAPTWEFGAPTTWTEIDPAFGDVRAVQTARGGVWTSAGSGEVVVGDAQAALLTRDAVGAGEIYFLADPSPLENAVLAEADNAAFGIALATTAPQQRIVFVEGVHGYGAERGLSAIPTHWKWAIGMLMVAALAFVWSRARRFGPPDRAARELPPARAEYVRALSQTLERTRDRANAFSYVQEWTRQRVIERASLRPEATAEEVVRAAQALGCSEYDAQALARQIMNDDEALALGRTLARVTGGDRSIT